MGVGLESHVSGGSFRQASGLREGDGLGMRSRGARIVTTRDLVPPAHDDAANRRDRRSEPKATGGFAKPTPLLQPVPVMTKSSCPPSTNTEQLAETSVVLPMSTNGVPAVMAPASGARQTSTGAAEPTVLHGGPQPNAKSSSDAQAFTDRERRQRRGW